MTTSKQANYLVNGLESKEKILNLISFTKIESEDKIDALIHHFVDGSTVAVASALTGVKGSKIRDLIETLNGIAEKCEKYCEIKAYKTP